MAIILLLALWLLILWLCSRGKFMFLHCVALDKAEVGVPWSKLGREANSLFWFRLVLSLIGTVLLLPVLVFKRSHPLYFLWQFGPEYDVFPPAPPAPPVTGLQPPP